MRLNIPRDREACIPSRLDYLDPRTRVACAVIFAVFLASADSFIALALGAIIPAALLILLLLDKKGCIHELLRALRPVNKMGLMVCLLLPLTAGGERIGRIFSVEGIRLALMIFCKLNLISVVIFPMVIFLGTVSLTNVMTSFRLPEKLRTLILLTLRCILLLTERIETMTRAVMLRAPEIKGLSACRAIAYMTGTTLLHSSDRAERTVLALQCRGGIGGFSQVNESLFNWRVVDTLACLLFALNAILVIIFSRISV